MLFYEPLFLFVFFPNFYLLYFFAERRYWLRGAVILLGSIAFYEWTEPSFAALVLVSCIADFLIARRIAKISASSKQAKLLLALGVVINLAMLVHFKYTRFLIQNLDSLLAGLSIQPISVPSIALPVGVSFVVFEKITYLVDVQRRLSQPARNFATYLTYVFFFPKLLAGPIIKYHEIESQLASLPKANANDFSVGFQRFMLGVVKKTLIADTLATGADMVFGNSVGAVSFAEAWWGVIFFTFQIYFDFSAYSDMAIGIARMLGFRLLENFNMPYISCSITEFWRRWHISLSTWIREYLYIPLGGNRVPPVRRYFNLWLCFFASGLWHGASWTYVIWGAYNGVFLVLDKLFLLRFLDKLPRWQANAFTFFVTVVGWTLFRAGSLQQAETFLSAMVRPGQTSSAQIFITNDIFVATALAAFCCVLPRLPRFDRLRTLFLEQRRWTLAMETALALLFICAVGKAVADPFKPFLYFRF